MGLVFANVPQAQAIRWTVEVSSKIFDCADVMAYGIFRKVTTLEFFQHHFAKSGHGDGLLMTRQLISTFRQPPLHYLTRSVRRTSGFVLADHSEVDPPLRTEGVVIMLWTITYRSSATDVRDNDHPGP